MHKTCTRPKEFFHARSRSLLGAPAASAPRRRCRALWSTCDILIRAPNVMRLPITTEHIPAKDTTRPENTLDALAISEDVFGSKVQPNLYCNSLTKNEQAFFLLFYISPVLNMSRLVVKIHKCCDLPKVSCDLPKVRPWSSRSLRVEYVAETTFIMVVG